jgi:hypothetical protein
MRRQRRFRRSRRARSAGLRWSVELIWWRLVDIKTFHQALRLHSWSSRPHATHTAFAPEGNAKMYSFDFTAVQQSSPEEASLRGGLLCGRKG